MALRLGELMVRRGLLSEQQVQAVLTEQQRVGGPFGEIAEELFGLDPKAVERIWAEQYASETVRIDPRTEPIDPIALSLVHRRQAWQFLLLPIRFDAGELVVCTTQDNLARALRFVYRRLERPCYFVLTEEGPLREALQQRFPAPGAGGWPPREEMRGVAAVWKAG